LFRIPTCSLFVLSLLTAPAVLAAEPAASAPATTAPPSATATAPASSPATTDTSETYRLLKLFGDVFERTREEYVEPKTDKELIEAALNGMLSRLDPHSAYLNQDELKDMQIQTRGKFGGLGIEVTMESGAVKVVAPIDETPAKKAGLKSGDLIVALDGKPVMGLTLQEAVNTMRGTPGTSIKLTVVRKGAGEPLELTIVRAIIQVQSVRSRTEGDVGYVRITSFTDQTQVGLDKALGEIKAKLGDKLQGIVLDLRDNPGGLLEQAVSVTDTFLDKGEIVSTRARNPDENRRYNSTPGDMLNGKPIVVLINGGSASASEIVSGALQDQRRAIVLGTKSFGKGSVQTVSPIRGYGAIRLTTARYYTPSGRSIQSEGIVPDLVVEPAKVEAIENKGLNIHEADLHGALRNDTPTPAEGKAEKPSDKPAVLPLAPKDEKPTEDASEKSEDSASDYQLIRALDLIRGLALYNSGPVTPVAATLANDTAKPVTEGGKPQGSIR